MMKYYTILAANSGNPECSKRPLSTFMKTLPNPLKVN